MNEEIAILLTTYNGEMFLCEQIESIMNQTYHDFVCYVHDDGSKDGTLNILKKMKEKYDEKIVILDYPRQGCPRDNFLSMIKYVNSPYVMFADQDDFWLPEKIQKTLEIMKEREAQSGGSAIAVYSDVKVVDEKLKTISESFYSYTKKNPKQTSMCDLIMHNVALGCTMMINRALYKRYRQSELTTIPNHDWLFMLLAKACGDVYYISEPLMLYRQHSKNSVGASKAKGFFNKLLLIIRLNAFGNQIKMEKETIIRQRKRAEEILNFNLPDNSQVVFLRRLKNIGSKGKLQRVKFYLSGHLHTKQNMLFVLIAC